MKAALIPQTVAGGGYGCYTIALDKIIPVLIEFVHYSIIILDSIETIKTLVESAKGLSSQECYLSMDALI